MPDTAHASGPLRLRLVIRGAVQGVGFRPFIYRLATGMGLHGWVNNSAQGVFIEVEGDRDLLESFLLRIPAERPPHAFIQSLESSFLDPIGYGDFTIRHSEEVGARTAFILPDLATCPDCRREILDATDRRYRYPFTNCTNCGPRFSIIQALPYDRPNTTMKHFTMCEACQAEYDNPLDRRFHAQPNACPRCGPHLELWNRQGEVLATHDAALGQAAEAIRQGQVVAVKGLGGFHLMVDARSAAAIGRLREGKHREEKPFAVMYPDLEAVRRDCEVAPLEERLLLAPECPIVLLRKRDTAAGVCDGVAPGNPYLGVMLPYTPLHHLLLADLGFPVVATSGNLTDEPICTDEHEVIARLGAIAELYLVHNRPIARHVDDSIVRVMLGREMVMRRARGYAPLPVHLKEAVPAILAVGAHLKNTVALAVGSEVFISQHIGDLETVQAYEAFTRVIADFEFLYDAAPVALGCDLHPDYLSTLYARQLDTPHVGVQHHFAHVLSCMAENELDGPLLGVAWDGTGYGTDATIWGGEFLRVRPGTGNSFERVAHLRTFRLPGGEAAIREPRRVALGLLYAMLGADVFARTDLAPLSAFTAAELRLLQSMLQRGFNCPVTSSAGRLFDAVASLIGLRQKATFEGQAAMELEFALHGTATDEHYPVAWHASAAGAGTAPLMVDWAPLVHGLLADLTAGVTVAELSARFHNTLAAAVVAVAERAGEEHVVLSGGCFQNRYLTERTVHRLRAAGFRPYWHQRVPTNDGGIALGQVVGVHLDRHEP